MLKKCDSNSYAEWDTFVLRNNGTIFQTTRWLKKYLEQIELWVFRDANGIQGGFCSIQTSKRGVRGYHIPPFCFIHGPLYSENKTLNYATFVSQLTAKLKGHIDFKTFTDIENILPYNTMGYANSTALTYQINPVSVDDYKSILNKNKLRELNKLLKAVSEGDIIIHEEVKFNDLKKIIDITGKRGDFDHKPEMVKKLFFDGDTSMIKVFSLEIKNEGLVSVAIFVEDDKCVYNMINASKRLNHKIYKTINLLTLYNGIQYAIEKGKVFDFEGSMIPGIAKFYSLMGGQVKQIIRLQKSPSIKYSVLRALHQIKSDRI